MIGCIPKSNGIDYWEWISDREESYKVKNAYYDNCSFASKLITVALISGIYFIYF